ncbi:MAG: squalene/phytoene synthase family protein, partial [Thermoguttaceae bacterium]|nr:squalene/phytoene synthase family protein [Thermoguttaceae bacterium]
MPDAAFATELQLYGPDARRPKSPTVGQARRYCRRLARRHYENFTVASLLLPRRLRRHFYHIYAYCRWADDLADETGDPGRSLSLLDWWEEQLRDCYRGHVSHPVFIA